MGAMWVIAQPFVASAVRHGLTAGAVYLAAKGIPGLDDATVSGLTAVAVGAAGMGWSMFDKAKRG